MNEVTSNVMANKINQFTDPTRRMTKPLTEVNPQKEDPRTFQDTFKEALGHPEGKGFFIDAAL